MKKSKMKRYRLILENIRKGKVINLGSGDRKSQNYFNTNLMDIINVDLIHGEKKFDLNNDFPLKSKSYENIIAGEIIEHLVNPSFFIKECYRILKKDGKLIITTPNMTGLPYIVDEDIGKDGFPHICSFNLEMLKYLLKKEGFRIIKSKYIDSFWKNNYFFRLIVIMFPRLRSNIFIVAEKK